MTDHKPGQPALWLYPEPKDFHGCWASTCSCGYGLGSFYLPSLLQGMGQHVRLTSVESATKLKI